ncbi:hypothetical protein ACJX0J_027900, partial [Zea mays]
VTLGSRQLHWRCIMLYGSANHYFSKDFTPIYLSLLNMRIKAQIWDERLDNQLREIKSSDKFANMFSNWLRYKSNMPHKLPYMISCSPPLDYKCQHDRTNL